MVETGTSSYYSALGEPTAEPVLKKVCGPIAADEFRHYKLFYDHLKPLSGAREHRLFGRLRIALGRIGESEDDELAFAYHCGNEPAMPYDHDRCIAAYMAARHGQYRFHHIERGTGMVLKAVGIRPRGRLSDFAKGTWRLLQWRRERYRRALAGGAGAAGGTAPRPAATAA